MQKLWWILAGIITFWLIVVNFGFLRIYTAHEEERGDVLWYEVCLEYSKSSQCLEIPKVFMDMLRVIGVRHSDTTISWISEDAYTDPFGTNTQN